MNLGFHELDARSEWRGGFRLFGKKKARPFLEPKKESLQVLVIDHVEREN